MFDLIADAFPHLRRRLKGMGIRRAEAAGVILAARFGERALAWSTVDCSTARQMIRTAFINRRALAPAKAV